MVAYWLAYILTSAARLSGLIPAAGEETFWCLNMLSLVSFAGMALNKCAVLWDVNWRPCAGRVTPVLVKESHIQLIPEHQVSFTEKTAFIKKKKIPTYPT